MTKSCRCVYCKGTRDQIADYAAELELLAAYQAGALKQFGAHSETCGTPPLGSTMATAEKVAFIQANKDNCTCGFDEAVQASAESYDRLHQLAGSFRCSPQRVQVPEAIPYKESLMACCAVGDCGRSEPGPGMVLLNGAWVCRLCRVTSRLPQPQTIQEREGKFATATKKPSYLEEH